MADSPTLGQRLLRPFTVNEVSTDQAGAYPELAPLKVDASADAIIDAAVEVVEARPRWRLVDVDRDAQRLSMEAESRIMSFVDDVTIRVDSNSAGRSVVHARSSSRVGEGDFGQNARTVEEFFERLERQLGV